MKVKLGDVCDKGSSNLKQSDVINQNGQYPVYGAAGLLGNIDSYHQDKPYVAVVKDGAGIGRVTLQPGYSSVIGTLQYLLPKENVLPEYLYYVTKHMHLEKYYTGATIPHIYFKDYKNEKFNLDAIEKQQRIVDILKKIENIIESRQQELQKLDDLIRARFVEMFGDNQEVHKLSDIAAITGGLTKNSRRDKLELRKPYLRVANVFFASIDTTEILDIGLTKEEYEKTLLRNGDLLFVEGNGSPDQIGRVAIWNGEIEDCVHQNHLIKARFDLKRMNPVFAMYYFISERGRNQIKKRAVSTSGLYTLSVSKIADFEIPNPPMELQQQFAAFVAAIDKSKLLSGCRLFHSWAPEIEISRSMLACPDGEQRICGDVDANNDAGRPGKS